MRTGEYGPLLRSSFIRSFMLQPSQIVDATKWHILCQRLIRKARSLVTVGEGGGGEGVMVPALFTSCWCGGDTNCFAETCILASLGYLKASWQNVKFTLGVLKGERGHFVARSVIGLRHQCSHSIGSVGRRKKVFLHHCNLRRHNQCNMSHFWT